jgi:hypothetical protein
MRTSSGLRPNWNVGIMDPWNLGFWDNGMVGLEYQNENYGINFFPIATFFLG